MSLGDIYFRKLKPLIAADKIIPQVSFCLIDARSSPLGLPSCLMRKGGVDACTSTNQIEQYPWCFHPHASCLYNTIIYIYIRTVVSWAGYKNLTKGFVVEIKFICLACVFWKLQLSVFYPIRANVPIWKLKFAYEQWKLQKQHARPSKLVIIHFETPDQSDVDYEFLKANARGSIHSPWRKPTHPNMELWCILLPVFTQSPTSLKTW